MSQHALAYRPEVDGLRAVAVLPVVLFHAGIAGFSGGFVGVDVFFVISGFLITAILAKEITAGEFSTLRFYERRIRRLFPALAAMYIVCWIVAAGLLMPHDFRNFARSVIASGAFSSNVLFWMEGDYFDVAAELKPLLHTWSLSVEEQFYILFPWLLLVLMTKVKQWRRVLGVLWVVSLAACVGYTWARPTAAFFLPMFRAWELLTGSFVALSIGFVETANPRVRTAAAALGVALVLWATFTFDQTTLFPGFSALMPCIGAALIIAYAQRTAVADVLGTAPFVWIGKISYSLYLWHWPIIVFWKYYVMRELHTSEKVGVVVLSVVLAYLSMRFVETPFRTRKFGSDARSLFKVAFATMACFFIAGAGTYVAKGLPQRFPASVQKMAQGSVDTNPRRNACDARSVHDIDAGNVCVIGASKEAPTFAVLGDSFGDALMPGIEAAAVPSGRRGMVLTHSGCYPLQGVVDANKHDDTCSKAVAASLDLIRRTPSITDVILVGRWTTAALGTRFGASGGSDWFINDGDSHELSYAENKRVFDRSLKRTVATLAGKRVHIVSYIPEQRVDVPRTLGLCRYLGRDCPSGISVAEYEKRQQFVRQVIGSLAETRAADVIDVGAKLCSAGSCSMVADDTVLYSDDNHLSRSGAIYIKDLFVPVFGAAQQHAASTKDGAPANI